MVVYGGPDRQDAPGYRQTPKPPGIGLWWQRPLGHGAVEGEGRVSGNPGWMLGGGLPALWGNEGALRRAEGLEVSRQGRGGGVQGHPTAPHAYPAHSSEHPGGRGGHRHPCPSDGCPLHGWSWPHRGVLTPQRGPKLLGGSIRPLSVGPHAIGGQPHSRVPDPQRGPTHGQNSPTEGSSPRRWVLKPRGEASATECPTARSPPH